MLAPEFEVSDDFPPVSPEDWRALVDSELAGVSFEKKLVTPLYEGISLQPLYTAKDQPSELDPNGFPGAAPYVRGASAFRRGWLVRQEYSHPDPATTNREILDDLQHGADSIELRLDAAVRAGLDASVSSATKFSGCDGVMIETLAELATALDRIRAEAAPVAIDAGAAFLPAAACLVAFWRRQGADFMDLRGTFGADPLGNLAATGRVGGSIVDALAQLGTLAAWTGKQLPRVAAVQVSTSTYHDSGANSVQNLGIAIATGVEYLRALVAAGLSIDDACRQIVFRFSVGTQFFRGIAKLRAARKLWARVAEASGASEPARAMRMHVATARRSLSQRDPWVNILRATVACFSGGVAGAESVGVLPFDARLGLPGEHSRRMARNTEIILAEESHLAHVADPAGGCWFLEKLTDQLAEEAWKFFRSIEAEGGMGRALASGWIAEKIYDSWSERSKNLNKRKDALIGVSEFPNLGEILPHPAEPEIAKLRAARAGREKSAGLPAALASIADSAGEPPAIMFETMIAAAEAGATLAAMNEALGARSAAIIDPLPLRSFGGAFEELRDASDAFADRTNSRPKVFLANLGPVAHHTARATWSRGFFESGGFEVLSGAGSADPAAAAAAWKASGAAIAVICSSDKIYATQAADTAKALKAAGARTVILAGHPGENRDSWTSAGVDHFIHIGCDVHATLFELLKEEGVLS